MSKTFQEIEISNGSWIKEQSDQINIFNDKKLIKFSEDTFRLFDAMIFISYNASLLMHALKISKQSLNYKDYWENSIDYIISEINLKEYNYKSIEGIGSFVLLWKIIANKNLSPKVTRNQLEIFMDYQLCKDEKRFSEKEIDGILYSQVNKTIGKYIREQTDYLNVFPKNKFKVNIDKTRINYEEGKKNLGNNLEEKYKNIFSNKIKEIKIDIYKFKDPFDNTIIKLRKFLFNKRIGKGLGIINKFNKDIKSKDYKDLFKRELRNWLKANLVTIKIISPLGDMFLVKIYAISFNFRIIVYKNVSNRNWAINFSKIKSNFNRSDNKYKNYFNNIRNLNDYFVLKNKNNRYGIKYE